MSESDIINVIKSGGKIPKKRGVNFTKNRQKEEGQNGEGKRERKRAGKK